MKNLMFVSAVLCATALGFGCGKDDPGKSDTNNTNSGSDAGMQGDASSGNDGGSTADMGGGDDSGGGGSDMSLGDNTAQTEHGPVRGTESDGILAFKGIPYAAAPVGDLRFRPPSAPEPWTSPIDGSLYGPVCPQRQDNTGTTVIGDEDCLSVNVWTAGLDGSRPVMVFIPGGGFVNGSGSYPLYEGQYLAGQDVVVVTMNYRLGALGFLAIEELAAEASEDTAGNYGLLDQIQALEWVRDNIAAFGGDPNNVTVFGESAGGSSICGHLASPFSAGLFNRAIIESGGGCGAYPYLRTGTLSSDPAVMTGTLLVDEAGCSGNADVAQCLRDVPAAELVNAQWNLGATGLGLPPFGLNIDGTVLPDLPIEMVRDGSANDVPVLTGSNADEATIFTLTTPVATANAYERIVRNSFGQTLGDQLLDIYPAGDYDSPKDAYNHLFSDVAFICSALQFADAASNGEPSYAYHFTQVPVGAAGQLGSFHGLELTYVFGTFAEAYPAYVPTADDLALRDRMMADWVGFATDGSLPWSAYDLLNPEIQVYGTPAEVVDEIREGRCADLRALGVLP